MLDYLYALSLLSITVTLFYLTKSCFAFKGEIPYQGEEITNRIEKVHKVLDELTDIINDFAQGLPSPDIAQMPSNPLMSILASIMTPKPMPSEHGETQEQKERQIHEINENPTQIETELS
jgi:hypothetical protein